MRDSGLERGRRAGAHLVLIAKHLCYIGAYRKHNRLTYASETDGQ